AAADEAEPADPLALAGVEREDASRLHFGEERARSFGVAAERIEDEAFEVRRLRDVHRRARGLVRFGGAADAVDAGAEELVEDVVLVGREHEAADRQAHAAGDVTG